MDCNWGQYIWTLSAFIALFNHGFASLLTPQSRLRFLNILSRQIYLGGGIVAEMDLLILALSSAITLRSESLLIGSARHLINCGGRMKQATLMR